MVLSERSNDFGPNRENVRAWLEEDPARAEEVLRACGA